MSTSKLVTEPSTVESKLADDQWALAFARIEKLVMSAVTFKQLVYYFLY